MYDFVPFSNIYFSIINYNFISFENSEKKKKKKKRSIVEIIFKFRPKFPLQLKTSE